MNVTVLERFVFQRDAIIYAEWCNAAGPACVAALQVRTVGLREEGWGGGGWVGVAWRGVAKERAGGSFPHTGGV
jgi:hypothetical protein